jgi:hypothetical protein
MERGLEMIDSLLFILAICLSVLVSRKNTRRRLSRYVFNPAERGSSGNVFKNFVYVVFLMIAWVCGFRHILNGDKYGCCGLMTEWMTLFIWLVLFLVVLGIVTAKNKVKIQRLRFFAISTFAICAIDIVYYFGFLS